MSDYTLSDARGAADVWRSSLALLDELLPTKPVWLPETAALRAREVCNAAAA